jgi:CBS domain-containing protein/uncharacterized membrane protein YdjX (TVP38/TMEM64 family)
MTLHCNNVGLLERFLRQRLSHPGVMRDIGERHSRRAALLIVAVLVVAVVAAAEPLRDAVTVAVSAAEPVMGRHPVGGGLLFVLWSAVSAMLVFFSAAVVMPIAIEAFGPWTTLLLVWIGWWIGGVTAFAIGRRFGRRIVRWFVDPRRLREYEERAATLATFGHILLFQLAVPSEIPGYVLGLSGCRFRRFALAMAIAEIPFAVGAVYLGSSFLEGNALVVALVGLAGVAITVIAFRASGHRAPCACDRCARRVRRKRTRFSVEEDAMLIKDFMTPKPVCCKPTDRIDVVAKLMAVHDCGEIPVCDGTKLVGVITDRDITCRVVATGKTAVAIPASEAMTRTVYTIRENETIKDALWLMEEKLVRRLPVLDEKDNLVGIVSQADLMARMPTLKVARTLKSVAKQTRRPTGYAAL